MKSIALAIVLLLATLSAQSSEVRLSLFEKRTSTTTIYSLESATLAFRQVDMTSGAELPQISKYEVSGRKLVADAIKFAEADEILYQCRVDELDFVVVRVENDSLSSPMKFLSALSGHPVQVSKIVVLTIKNGRVISEKEITQKDSSYHWVAKVLK
jgi:hypothetical protein